MAADLHIHVFEEIIEDDLKAFFCNTIGSKYFDPGIESKDWDEAFQKIARTHDIWIGEVSWLKAGLFNDSDRFIPKTVENIQELIGEELPVIDDELIEKILDAFDSENKTGYRIAKKEDVEKFLIENKGKRVFTVSW